jgi:hypothetical protein
VLVNFYHGFHQPGRLDRQTLKLVFEHGDIELSEWVPTRYRILAGVNEAQARRLTELLPHAHLEVVEGYQGSGRKCRGHFKDYDIYQLCELSGGTEHRKSHVYGQLLRDMFADQMAWICDRSHVRRITSANGRNSVAVAQEADRLARRS